MVAKNTGGAEASESGLPLSLLPARTARRTVHSQFDQGPRPRKTALSVGQKPSFSVGQKPNRSVGQKPSRSVGQGQSPMLDGDCRRSVGQKPNRSVRRKPVRCFREKLLTPFGRK